MPWLYSGETKTNASSDAIFAAHRLVCGCWYLPIEGGIGSSSKGSSKSLMSTSSYSASLRFRAASSTHLATSADFRFGRVLPVMIPTLSIGDSCRANMALILRGLWCGLGPGGRAELLEQLDERRALVLGEPTGRQI